MDRPVRGRGRIEGELRERGFRLLKPTRAEGGRLYRNDATGDEIRIMARDTDKVFSNDPIEKHLNSYYYRYRPRNGPWGEHTTILDKQ